MHVLGEFAEGLGSSGALAHIRLLKPSGTLCHDILACLVQLAKLGTPGGADMADKVYLVGTSSYALRSIIFGALLCFRLL